MRTTILGLGNILLKDEGFGVRFLQEMEKNYLFPDNVKLVDGGTLGYGLLDTISSCERLLVIDVIKSEIGPAPSTASPTTRWNGTCRPRPRPTKSSFLMSFAKLK